MLPEAPSERDFHALGLPPDAKQAEVKRAYRALVKLWHPDRHHLKPYEVRARAEEKFKQIDEAYKRISRSWAKRPDYAQGPRPGKPGGRRETPGREPRPENKYQNDMYPRIRAARLVPAAVLAAVLFVLVYQLASLFLCQEQEADQPIPVSDGVPSGPGDFTPPSSLAPESAPGEAHAKRTPAAPPPPSEKLLLSPEPSKPFFTIGSTSAEVLRVQGAPSRIQGQTWVYGLSEVRFRHGRVWQYNNFDGSLRVRLLPAGADERAAPADFTIGSTEDDVLRAQGTPTRVERDKWFYGFSTVRFQDGRVREYDNHFGHLKVRLLPSTRETPPKPFFTIGSTTDEVLAVQGTPSSVQGNIWSFNFSSIFFRDGKVQYVTDLDGVLHYLPPEEYGKAPGS